MERPTSDKILFINSDILIHIMPSKCGILNLGISRKISSHSCSTLSTILAPSEAPRNMSLRSYRFSRNIFQILSRRILASCVAGWFVAAYLCGFVAPGSVCGGITAVEPQCSSVHRALCGRETRADNLVEERRGGIRHLALSGCHRRRLTAGHC